MSANPHANGGALLQDLELPDFRDYAVKVEKPGKSTSEATRVVGAFLRDVMAANPDNFRLFGPDETASNRLGSVFEVTGRTWEAAIEPTDDGLSRRPSHGGAVRAHVSWAGWRATPHGPPRTF